MGKAKIEKYGKKQKYHLDLLSNDILGHPKFPLKNLKTLTLNTSCLL